MNDQAGVHSDAAGHIGNGQSAVPFQSSGYGDSNAFVAPRVVVQLTGQQNGNCKIALYNPANGQKFGSAEPAKGTVTLDSYGSPTAYLQFHSCHAWV